MATKQTTPAPAAELTELQLAHLLYARAQTDYLRIIAERAAIAVDKRSHVDEITEQLVIDLGAKCGGLGKMLREPRVELDKSGFPIG